MRYEGEVMDMRSAQRRPLAAASPSQRSRLLSAAESVASHHSSRRQIFIFSLPARTRLTLSQVSARIVACCPDLTCVVVVGSKDDACI